VSSVHLAYITNRLEARRLLLGELVAPAFARVIETVSERIADTFRRGGTVYLCGNGGSASDSDHIAAEFVGRFKKDRAPLPAMALTTSPAAITSIANDFSFDEIYARQVIAMAGECDVVVGLSTSGSSINVIRAMEAARTKGAFSVAFTGQLGDKLAETADLAVRIPSTEAAQIQEATLMAGHVVCEIVESMLGLLNP
jgi:D-sedoheptulose 7-phosphate isomerase